MVGYNTFVRLKIVTWNTNQTLPTHKLQARHWEELKNLEPSLLILTECKDFGDIPAWVTDWRPPNAGIAIAVTTGKLSDKDIAFAYPLKSKVCDWQVAPEISIAVAGVHVHREYGNYAQAWLCALKTLTGVPTIAAGDFNINPNYNKSDFERFDRARRELKLRSCWHDCRSANFGGEPPTWRNYWGDGRPNLRNGLQCRNFMVDYVLVSEQFSVHHSDIAEMEGIDTVQQKRWINSDHKAIWAGVSLNGKRTQTRPEHSCF